MVASLLWEVSTKARELYGSDSSSVNTTGSTSTTKSKVTTAAAAPAPKPTPAEPTNTSSVPRSSPTDHNAADDEDDFLKATSEKASQIWDYASASIHDVTDSTYSAVSKMISDSWKYYETSTDDDEFAIPPTLHKIIAKQQHEGQTIQSKIPRRGSFAFTLLKSSPADVTWLMMFKNNPYNSVRGRQVEPSSMSAVRDLIALVPDYHPQQQQVQEPSSPQDASVDENWTWNPAQPLASPQKSSDVVGRPSYHRKSSSRDERSLLDEDWTERTIDADRDHRSNAFHRRSGSLSSQLGKTQKHQHEYHRSSTYYSPSETASQLAEGTIRALRDLALDEAVELQSALRFWTERWERPFLSWLEAGPAVWASDPGYNHQEVGRKVSEIQAVLARRCASIGELQQQLLTAGWAKGVAQWGFLGGSQWAAVAGFDNEVSGMKHGEVERHMAFHTRERSRLFSGSSIITQQQNDQQYIEPNGVGDNEIPERNDGNGKKNILTDIQLQQKQSSLLKEQQRLPVRFPAESHFHANQLLSCNLDDIDSTEAQPKLTEPRINRTSQTNQAGIFVRKRNGGGIYVDDPGFLALWSVQAMSLVRRHLYRAGNGMFLIPCQSHWPRISGENEGQMIVEAGAETELPIWASHVGSDDESPSLNSLQIEENDQEIVKNPTARTHVTITDLPLMVDEVQQLLDIMEDIMIIQKRRRLNKLRQPSWLRCNWYIVATVIPATVMLARSFGENGYVNGKQVLNQLIDAVKSFYREHLRDPLVAIANELLKGREDFSDKKARMEAISSLKKMIYSWLEDTFPEMPESQRRSMAEAMDVTLLEQKKEESLKAPFYELNNVVRMSFIEMQYMKKEMMNALHAMDQMISANDINLNIAAITPAVIMAYAINSVSRFFAYAFLKLGKSREETYASFRHIMADVERLLVMRDNPPLLYPASFEDPALGGKQPCLLGPDDLGMLMLLIHECRSIMLKDKRRFTQAIIRSVSEDLAELAGERGAVSVQQQLRIVERMCRSYPFLKVISTGHSVHFNKLRNVVS